MTTLGFIGAGPVGTAFAVNLAARGYDVAGVYDVNGSAADQLAGAVAGCWVCDTPEALAAGADMIFITTPDDIIPEAAGSVTWHQGQVAVHCSGASNVHALDAAAAQGADVGAIHPCQTFAGRDQAVANLPASTFAIEAAEPVRSSLTEIAQALHGDVVYLSAEDKVLYHAAACIASAYFYTLVDVATDLWQTFGKSKDAATRAYVPLLQGSVDNIANIGFPGCPTGPILRGDVRTIQNHLDSLQKSAPDILPLYRALSLRSIPVGTAKGTLSADKAAELKALLEA